MPSSRDLPRANAYGSDTGVCLPFEPPSLGHCMCMVAPPEFSVPHGETETRQLPRLVIGYTSLVSPQGLGIYWTGPKFRSWRFDMIRIRLFLFGAGGGGRGCSSGLCFWCHLLWRVVSGDARWGGVGLLLVALDTLILLSCIQNLYEGLRRLGVYSTRARGEVQIFPLSPKSLTADPDALIYGPLRA